MAIEPLPAAKRASELAEQYREVTAKIRGRTDASVKALGTIGTAAVTAVGYAKLADFYPYGGPIWAVPALILGVVAMSLAVIYLVRRFQGVSDTIITSSDIRETCGVNRLGRMEEGTVTSAYRQTARLNGVESLRAYEARAHRFERIAATAEPGQAASLREQADLIRAEVGATEDRAALFVVRERARSALFAKATAVLLLLFVAGWYATAVAADAMQSERSEGIDLKKSCLELGEKESQASLPTICGQLPKAQEEESNPAQAAADGVAAIAKLWSECREGAEKAGQPEAECAPLRRALEASTAAGA
jgi:hypothetical protein